MHALRVRPRERALGLHRGFGEEAELASIVNATPSQRRDGRRVVRTPPVEPAGLGKAVPWYEAWRSLLCSSCPRWRRARANQALSMVRNTRRHARLRGAFSTTGELSVLRSQGST